MALIEFKNVNKYYGDYHALRDINLEIEKGQVVVLLGPSGSGKSTLIRTINALESIDNGTLIVNGHNVTEASAKDLVELRKEAGMVFQHFNLYPHKTVLENVTLARFLESVRQRLKRLLKNSFATLTCGTRRIHTLVCFLVGKNNVSLSPVVLP